MSADGQPCGRSGVAQPDTGCFTCCVPSLAMPGQIGIGQALFICSDWCGVSSSQRLRYCRSVWPTQQPMGILSNLIEEISDMEKQLYQDRFGAIIYDAAKQILELRWFAETEVMTENDFRGWIERYATAAEQHHVPFALI